MRPTVLEAQERLRQELEGEGHRVAVLDRVRAGDITAAQTVVYVNTGGSPAVFANSLELMEHGAATPSR